MSTNTPIKLRIPRQDQEEFSLFPCSKEGAAQWAGTLPVANTRQTVARLREAVSELNRAQMPPDTRFAILEALFPRLEVTLANLARRFLNQPLILPEEPRQFSELAENLYSLFSTGYTVVAVHAIQQRGTLHGANPARLACEALQRALEFAGQRMLQTYQLQQHVEPQGWLTLHQLFALGERQQLDALPLTDIHQRPTTLRATYLRTLLLGCVKANQLRQSDLTTIYHALGEWSHHAQLLRAASAGALFVVDLHSDQPPVYYNPAAGDGDGCRYLDTSELIAHLTSLRDQDRARGRKGISLDNKLVLSANILEHLIASLGSRSQRNFSRQSPDTGAVDVAVGLSSVHYHAAGERPFIDLLPKRIANAMAGGSNPFAIRSLSRDPWEESEPDDVFRGDEDRRSAQEDQVVPVDEATASRLELGGDRATDTRFKVFTTRALNASPGGYCLEWDSRVPRNLRTGELVCLREHGQSDWLIAAVRWMSAMENAHTLLGVELLSPRGMPYGAQVMGNKNELSQPVRVLLLPEIKLVGKPHTLITPQAGFRERQKLVLLREGEEFLVQLQHQVGATGSFSEFDFRYIKPLEQRDTAAAEEAELPRSAFDSLWSDI